MNSGHKIDYLEILLFIYGVFNGAVIARFMRYNP
jgi:hypothetical protein